MGNLLLFATLSAIMLGTRRFDWYGLGQDAKAASRTRETKRSRVQQAWEYAARPAGLADGFGGDEK
ncbi:MAG: hypothetical protein LBT71_00820 [Azoarcus sp.]|nr:hypothetical protein [Azoarcus sp.]